MSDDAEAPSGCTIYDLGLDFQATVVQYRGIVYLKDIRDKMVPYFLEVNISNSELEGVTNLRGAFRMWVAEHFALERFDPNTEWSEFSAYLEGYLSAFERVS